MWAKFVRPGGGDVRRMYLARRHAATVVGLAEAGVSAGKA
jgi:hypothetical protein